MGVAGGLKNDINIGDFCCPPKVGLGILGDGLALTLEAFERGQPKDKVPEGISFMGGQTSKQFDFNLRNASGKPRQGSGTL